MAQDDTFSMAQPIAGIAVLVVVAVFLFRFSQGEAAFCRRALADLAGGRPSAQRAIDWERLQAMGTDVGATYAKLPGAKEKAQYRQAFIQKFAEGFRQAGGKVEAFTGWRVEQRDGRRVVAAEHPATQSTLLAQVSGGWRRKRLVSLQWQ